MKVVRTALELRGALAERRGKGDVGLVPTMGAFHDGHRSLFDAARAECGTVVASLFVNPAQFAPGEDYAAYPRDEPRDVAAAEAASIDVLFIPDRTEIYPPGFDTWVDPGALGEMLEGTVRPGHFRGVATVCLKLFNLVGAQRVYFGRKDAQQVAVIRAMLRDLDLEAAITLRVLPTVRDTDGLALSSRNAYLSTEERQRALALPRALDAGLAAHRAGGDPVDAARAVLDAADGVEVDYVAVAAFDGPTLAAAIRMGRTRLIDNVLLKDEDADGGG
ncbi:MAG TPA: pantoate--beta-alanine ligase [Candidatus Limnocylindria bacterium]|jgi:pantoate--beta-alanine ligase|nr:pantoate--beta-alanine ligase [Candidatus Limnocylindria bacterium]